MASRVSGTFDAVEVSEEVTGKGVSIRGTWAGVATVVLQFYDVGLADWVTARSYTATLSNMPVVIEDVVKRRWRLNCTAYTNNVTYTLDGGRA